MITGKLLAACLVALESFTRDQDQAEKKEEETEDEDDNQKINKLSKNQILV